MSPDPTTTAAPLCRHRDIGQRCGAPATLNAFSDDCSICREDGRDACAGHPVCEAHGASLRTTEPEAHLRLKWGPWRLSRLCTLAVAEAHNV